MLVKQLLVRDAHKSSVQMWGGGLRENDPDCYVEEQFPREIRALIGYVEEVDTWLTSQYCKYAVGDLIEIGVWCNWTTGKVQGGCSSDSNGKRSLLMSGPNIFSWEGKVIVAGNNDSDYSQIPPTDFFH